MGTHPIFESDFDCLTDEENLILGDRKMSSKNVPFKASIMIPAKMISCERPVLAKRLLAKGALGNQDSKEIIFPSKKTITSTTTSASFSEDSTSSSTSFFHQ